MYGVFPRDMALAGAAASGNADAGAAYHNPAALADLTSTDITGGYLYAKPFFRGGLRGDSKGFGEPNQVVLVGLTLDLGRVFPKDYPVGAGLNMLVDDNFRTLVVFDDVKEDSGRFARYGPHSFMLVGGAGVRIVPGLNLGAGFILTYNAAVYLNQDVEITGSIEDEQINLRGRSLFIPIIALQGTIGPVRIGAVYRHEQRNNVDPVGGDTQARIAGLPILRYPNDMCFLDGFAPSQAVLGVSANLPKSARLAVQGEWHHWAPLGDALTRCDDPGDDVELRTVDVWVPRLAATWKPAEAWELRGGYAYEASPVTKLGSGGDYVLDNDRHRVTAGVGFTHPLPGFAKPWSFDLALIYLQLVPRDERTKDLKVLRSDGFLLGASVSVTFGY